MWAAPTATRPVDAVLDVPASKSVMARALVLAALAAEPTTIHRPLVARDSLLMAGALAALGADVHMPTDGPWTLRPGRPAGRADVDCGLAGTVMRFVPPVAVLAGVPVRFDGDPRARQRPLGPLLDALRTLGARTTPAHARSLPVTIEGTAQLRGGDVTIDAATSSQFLSGLLLAGCRYPGGLHVHATAAVPSRPHVTMTVQMLAERGVAATATGDRSWQVPAGRPAGGDVAIEPDLSNAAVFLAAALVTGGRVRVPGWPRRTTQPAGRLLTLLQAMGAAVDLGDGGLTVTGGDRLHGMGTVDLSDVGELTPTLAALAALADSPSTFTGIAHLRGHETDRIRALACEIRALGGRAEETDDGLHIEPAPLHGGVVSTYDDHRMATFGALLGLAVPDVVVDDIAATGKTMPTFPRLWKSLLA
jgi:3-phosphoshikimate 1-carboxyvinyltransferase